MKSKGIKKILIEPLDTMEQKMCCLQVAGTKGSVSLATSAEGAKI